MNRTFEYPLQLLPDTDLLNIQRNTIVETGGIMQAAFGTTTVVDGFACIATTPASLQVIVGPGSIFSQQNLDSTNYGSLLADTTHTVVKQGRNLGSTTLSCPAPSSSGQSINYLIQAAFSEVDTNSTVLNYFNSANPAQPYTGPGNNGAAQPTLRATSATLQAKAGVAATTGSQATPAPDTGFVALWVVTVANAQTTITSGNIVQATSAPFIGIKLPNVQTAINARLSGFQKFTASGTYTVPTGVTSIQVEVIGGGGGGWGSNGGNTLIGAGGGGGGYAQKICSVTPGQSISVTIGGGGTAGPATNTSGGDGASSSFGAFCSASGGLGGKSGVDGAGGTGVGGDLNLTGGPGNISSVTTLGCGGGGAPVYGQGAGNGSPVGAVAVGPGAGGASAASNVASAGVAGLAGIVIVRW